MGDRVKVTQRQIEARSAHMRRLWADPEWRAATMARRRAKREARDARLAERRAAWEARLAAGEITERQRDARRVNMTRLWADEEFRERHAEVQVGRLVTMATRKKMKKAWAKKRQAKVWVRVKRKGRLRVPVIVTLPDGEEIRFESFKAAGEAIGVTGVAIGVWLRGARPWPSESDCARPANRWIGPGTIRRA